MSLIQVLTCIAILISVSAAQKDPNFWSGRNTIVHLFEWKWNDIADECERFLQYKGYGGVQVSPPSENLVVENRPWWERYQPVSYIINTRSGNQDEFLGMTTRCNAVGVRIYIDAVINHMTGGSGTGTAGNSADVDNEYYPAVPYTSDDFHEPCDITDYQDAENVRNCRLVNLLDLDHTKDNVRGRIIDYMNNLIDLGVAGFRVDAAKHMWPGDLETIYSSLKNLNPNHGFDSNARPFIFQEVMDLGGEAVSKNEYTSFGTINEFKYGTSLSNVFQGNDKLTFLENWGTAWGLVEGVDAVAFIDNHDNQRAEGSIILTYKKPKEYVMAIAFMLAHPYGTTRVMSSYDFNNFDQPPPQDGNGNLLSPGINADGSCSNGYVCEHRWRQHYNMVGFRNAVFGTGLNDWWSNGDQQIAFCRGDRGFVAFTTVGDIAQDMQTCLSAGTYCDVISGSLENGQCTGKSVLVGDNGFAFIALSTMEQDGVLAIHADAKLS